MRNFKVISEIEPTGRAVFTNSKLGATCCKHFEIINIFITHSVGSHHTWFKKDHFLVDLIK